MSDANDPIVFSDTVTVAHGLKKVTKSLSVSLSDIDRIIEKIKEDKSLINLIKKEEKNLIQCARSGQYYEGPGVIAL